MFGTSKDIKYPGLNILPPGVERHVVNGGALTAFQILYIVIFIITNFIV